MKLAVAISLTLFGAALSLDGMLGKITSGFEIVGKYLGLDYASEVATLVSEAFSKPARRTTGEGDDGSNIFSGFLRIMGFDTKKIGAIAVNAIIFVAQLISSSLTRNTPAKLSSRELRDGSPLEWIMNNTRVSDVLEEAKNSDLPGGVIDYIKEHSLDEETDCLQLLVCKTGPFVAGMQRALAEGKETQKLGKEALFEYLPAMEEIAVSGEECERRHPYCTIH